MINIQPHCEIVTAKKSLSLYTISSLNFSKRTRLIKICSSEKFLGFRYLECFGKQGVKNLSEVNLV